MTTVANTLTNSIVKLKMLEYKNDLSKFITYRHSFPEFVSIRERRCITNNKNNHDKKNFDSPSTRLKNALSFARRTQRCCCLDGYHLPLLWMFSCWIVDYRTRILGRRLFLHPFRLCHWVCLRRSLG